MQAKCCGKEIKARWCLISLLLVTQLQTAHADVIENTCVCQGYGINGDNPDDAAQFSYVDDPGLHDLASARNEAIHDCRMGYNRGNGSLCSPAPCPPGSIETTPLETLPASRDRRVVSKLIRCPGDNGDITRTWDRGWQLHTPKAAGCSQIGDGRYQCSVQCVVVRQCVL